MEFVEGVAAFTLKHGEKKTAIGLPVGVSYTVAESGNEGYTVTSAGETGTIVGRQTAQAVFNNHKDRAAAPEETPMPGGEIPKTGDTNNLALYGLLALLFIVGLIAAAVPVRPKKAQ